MIIKYLNNWEVQYTAYQFSIISLCVCRYLSMFACIYVQYVVFTCMFTKDLPILKDIIWFLDVISPSIIMSWPMNWNCGYFNIINYITCNVTQNRFFGHVELSLDAFKYLFIFHRNQYISYNSYDLPRVIEYHPAPNNLQRQSQLRIHFVIHICVISTEKDI